MVLRTQSLTGLWSGPESQVSLKTKLIFRWCPAQFVRVLVSSHTKMYDGVLPSPCVDG